MLLEPREAAQFNSLYQPFMAFAAADLGSVAGASDQASFKIASVAAKAQVLGALNDHPELIAEYADTNTGSRDKSSAFNLKATLTFEL